MKEFIDHVTGDDALRGMNQIDVFTNLKAVLLNHRTHELVNGAGAHGGFNHDCCTFRAVFHHFLDGSYYIASVHLFRELVVRGRNGDNVHVCLLILGGELDARLHGSLEEFIQTVFLEGGLTGVESSNKLLVIVRTNDLHTVRSHHQCCGQSNVAQSNYVNHITENFTTSY